MSTDKKAKSKRRNPITTLIIILVMIIAAYFGIDLTGLIPEDFANIPVAEVTKPSSSETIASIQTDEEQLIITMLDVGQGDSFLLESDGKVMLIDCGEAEYAEEILAYLKKEGITRIDEFYGTHYHDDHIGAMYDIITNNDIQIGTIYLPKIEEGLQTADWYLGLKTELRQGGHNVKYVVLGEEYQFGYATVKVIGPISDPGDELNNYSTILLVSLGEMDILFTGDAEKTVEKDLIASGENIDVEILKIGHHGSNTSSSAAFLDATSPDYALISCGLGNIHKHPTETIMERLESRNIEVYRTDEAGTIVVTITRNGATFSTEPGDYLSGTELKEKEGKK